MPDRFQPVVDPYVVRPAQLAVDHDFVEQVEIHRLQPFPRVQAPVAVPAFQELPLIEIDRLAHAIDEAGIELARSKTLGGQEGALELECIHPERVRNTERDGAVVHREEWRIEADYGEHRLQLPE